MNNIDLRIFGLNQNQAKVYLALLKLGQANVLEIANKTGLSRISVYDTLEDLSAYGYISFILRGKRKFYIPESPKKLEKKLIFEQKLAQKQLPLLENLFNTISHRPSVYFLEGKEGLKSMVEDVLASIPDSGQYEVMYNPEAEMAIVGKETWDKWVEERKRRNIWIRLICERSRGSKKWAKKGEKTNRVVRFLPKGQKILVSYHIYGNKVSIFSLSEPVVGVIIENNEIAEMQRLQFEYIWKALK